MSGWSEKLLERGIQFVRKQDWEGAARVLSDAVKYDTGMYEAWVLRGNVRMAQEMYLDAALHYERAISIKGDLADAWSNLGSAFLKMGMYQAARDAYRRSMQVKDSWEPHAGLANMYCDLMDLKQAEEECQKALAIDNTADRHFYLGCVQLGQGKWKEGFENYYYRWLDHPQAPLARRALPQWQGEDLTGRTIVLYPNQGFGDEIMAMRFASRDCLSEARHIVLQTRSPLADIARHPDREIKALNGTLPRADYACSTLDLPMVLGLNWDEVNCPPYLTADPVRAARWRERMPKGFNIGVCWTSGGHFSSSLSIQRIKSMRVEALAAFKQPGVNLISLQKPVIEAIPAALEITDWMEEVDDFADTAALIAALDLVISVDTSVAHIAGAIGARVWNFVRFSGYWPWLAPDVCGPDKSIWYPSMKLYRQPRGHDWEEPVRRAAKDLEVLLADTVGNN